MMGNDARNMGGLPFAYQQHYITRQITSMSRPAADFVHLQLLRLLGSVSTMQAACQPYHRAEGAADPHCTRQNMHVSSKCELKLPLPCILGDRGGSEEVHSASPYHGQ